MKIQLRRGTAALWTSVNPILSPAEFGVETDTLKVKVGNGTTAWTSLGYLGPSAGGGGGNVAADTHAASAKTTPVDADEFPMADSAASFLLKRVTWGNIKATIKAYYDSVTSTLTNKNLTSGTNTFPTFNQNTTGTAASAATWTTARNLAGNSTDGSANVPFSNKFVVQGTADTGLSGAQFMGALGTGLVKNTTTTGVQSIAIPGTDYVLPGGAGSMSDPLTTAGDIIVRGASATLRKAVGTNGQMLQVNTANADKLAYITPDKNLVGLGNVDNTSDVTKWAAAKTLTNTTISAAAGSGNTITGLPVTALATLGPASSSTVLYGDMIWRVPAGGGGSGLVFSDRNDGTGDLSGTGFTDNSDGTATVL